VAIVRLWFCAFLLTIGTALAAAVASGSVAAAPYGLPNCGIPPRLGVIEGVTGMTDSRACAVFSDLRKLGPVTRCNPATTESSQRVRHVDGFAVGYQTEWLAVQTSGDVTLSMGGEEVGFSATGAGWPVPVCSVDVSGPVHRCLNAPLGKLGVVVYGVRQVSPATACAAVASLDRPTALDPDSGGVYDGCNWEGSGPISSGFVVTRIDGWRLGLAAPHFSHSEAGVEFRHGRARFATDGPHAFPGVYGLNLNDCSD
jgi:hypothetical protein